MEKWIFVENEEIPENFLCKACKHKRSLKNCIKMDLTIVKNWKKNDKRLNKFKDDAKLFKCKENYWIIIS